MCVLEEYIWTQDGRNEDQKEDLARTHLAPSCVRVSTRHLLSANNLARTKEAYYAKETHGVVHICDHFLCTAFLFRAEL